MARAFSPRSQIEIVAPHRAPVFRFRFHTRSVSSVRAISVQRATFYRAPPIHVVRESPVPCSGGKDLARAVSPGPVRLCCQACARPPPSRDRYRLSLEVLRTLEGTQALQLWSLIRITSFPTGIVSAPESGRQRESRPGRFAIMSAVPHLGDDPIRGRKGSTGIGGSELQAEGGHRSP